VRIDYQRLKQRMAQPAVRRQLGLAGVADADHLLSFFRLDEAAFAALVRDVPPVTDDFTVLDFTMPRYIGSGFGLGQFNFNVHVGQHGPFAVVAERMAYYGNLRRSPVPLLTQTDGEAPEAIEARIAARRQTAIKHPYVSETAWSR
jgi:hypothetical protein